MKNIKIKKKINKLKKKINKYDLYYFYKNKSIISDEKYDYLIKKLEKLENKYTFLKNKNSPTKKINYKFKNYFKIEKHNFPMLSIKNIYKYKELYKYIKQIKKKIKIKKFCCELKIDGIAISILYENNKLKKAITRGNGIFGENITKNIKYIKDIPKKIKTKQKIKNIEIRGEIYIKKKNFYKLKKNFSNSRNITAGTIRQSNIKLIKKRKLSFIAYDVIIHNNRKIFIEQSRSIKKLKFFGFKTEKNIKIYNKILNIKNFFKKIKKKRKKIKFDIDGIVIKINNKYHQEIIGYNKKYIKWAIAWKFPSEKKKTQIKKIKFQVSKNGTIVPILIIKKIKINNVKIKKINLHNLNYLNKLSLSENNKIIVERAGDVIPKIYKIINSKKKKIIIPKKCPLCKKKINIKEKIPKCKNIKCPSKIENIIVNFVSKKGINVIGLGKKIIKKLINYKQIKSIIDIINISKKKLIKIPNIKNKLAEKIENSIKNSIKKIKLNNLIYSISIPNIGSSLSENISEKIKSFDEFIKIKKNKLKKIKILGKTRINSIINFIKKNKKFLIKLNNNIINIIKNL